MIGCQFSDVSWTKRQSACMYIWDLVTSAKIVRPFFLFLTTSHVEYLWGTRGIKKGNNLLCFDCLSFEVTQVVVSCFVTSLSPTASLQRQSAHTAGEHTGQCSGWLLIFWNLYLFFVHFLRQSYPSVDFSLWCSNATANFCCLLDLWFTILLGNWHGLTGSFQCPH